MAASTAAALNGAGVGGVVIVVAVEIVEAVTADGAVSAVTTAGVIAGAATSGITAAVTLGVALGCTGVLAESFNALITKSASSGVTRPSSLTSRNSSVLGTCVPPTMTVGVANGMIVGGVSSAS